MKFWQRTWDERISEIRRAFGETWPPNTVYPFSWSDMRCPGACALSMPPIDQSRDPLRYRRDDWLYLTLGLSQPIDETQFRMEREAGKQYSSYGIEFAFLIPNEAKWAVTALYHFMTYMTEGEHIAWGDRFPMQFNRSNRELAVTTGNPDEITVSPIGKIRGVLFWPYLFPDWEFVTSTGKFMVMIATGITQAEWELAKQSTTVHLLLLLCRAGIGQRTIPDRECLMDNPKWEHEWRSIKLMEPEECEGELQGLFNLKSSL